MMIRPRKVAVLCSGSSIELYPGGDEYDAVIGVNRAATRHRCDYWVCIDGPAAVLKIPGAKVIGEPVVLESWKRTENAKFRVMFIKGIPGYTTSWGNKSSLAAVAFAIRLGAEEIDCYGMDWEGSCDWDGRYTQNRSNGRWSSERSMVELMQKEAKEHGVRIRRITEDSQAHCGALSGAVPD